MPTVLEQTADYILEEIKNVTQQLTRIADAMGSTVAIVDFKPTPQTGLATDALVEAVKVFLRHEICGGYEKPTWEKHSVRHLQDALAVHEKAVRDGT